MALFKSRRILDPVFRLVRSGYQPMTHLQRLYGIKQADSSAFEAFCPGINTKVVSQTAIGAVKAMHGEIERQRAQAQKGQA